MKLLRKADLVESGSEPAHAAAEALATGPVPTRPSLVTPGRRPSPGLLAAGALGVISLVGAGVLLSSSSEKASPHPRGQQGDAALVDGERARQMEQALTSGDLARLEALVDSCGDEPQRCRQSLAVADELTRMRAATCGDGRPVFEVFAAAGEAARRGKWVTVRDGLEPCRGPTGLGFRGEGLHARAQAELSVADELDRAEALLRAGGSATELNAVRRQIEAMYTTTSSEPRRRALVLALASATPSPAPASQPPAVAVAATGTPSPEASRPQPTGESLLKQALVEEYLSEARGRIKKGNFKGSVRVLEQCLKADPRAYNCHKLLGSAYASMASAENSTRHADKGVQHYQRYLDLAPLDEPDVPKVRKLVEAYKNRSR